MKLWIGLMSGTSMDAIDVALVEIKGKQVQLRAGYRHQWPDWLRERLLEVSLYQRGNVSLHEVASLDVQTGEVFAEAVLNLLNRIGLEPQQVAAVGSPGQTIFHCPGGNPPYTWQIGDPNVLAERTGIVTVADFRRRDVAAGGQGAPLASAFHNAIFRDAQEDRAVLNIGGIANITVLPADSQQPVIGFDTGPGNGIMDSFAGKHGQGYYDEGGKWAGTGQVQDQLLAKLLADPYFMQAAPKTTGRDYFNLDWLDQHIGGENYAAADIQSTLCQLTVETVVEAAKQHAVQRLLICGGGVHNGELLRRLRMRLSNCQVESTAKYGVDPDWVEAMCFAWLAQQRLAQELVNLSSVTGARQAVVLGGIYC